MVLAEIEAWLLTKGVTLWGDWDVTNPKRRRKAAKWFLQEMQSYEKFHMTNIHVHSFPCDICDAR